MLTTVVVLFDLFPVTPTVKNLEDLSLFALLDLFNYPVRVEYSAKGCTIRCEQRCRIGDALQGQPVTNRRSFQFLHVDDFYSKHTIMRTTTVLLFAVILLLARPAEAQDDNLLGQLFRALLDLLCSLPLLDLFCNAGGGCDGYRPWWTLVQEVCDADTEFCEHPVDTCLIVDLGGTCVQIPDACTLNIDPVCGCDGITYDNDCVRQAARVSKASDGPCPATCGGIAGTACSQEDEFCEYEAGTCGFADASGTCVHVSVVCPFNFVPVCGCDGTTYNNDCLRQAARVSKERDGACTTATTCGGIAGTICTEEDEFCDYDAGSCEFADASGECVPIPENCIEIYDPVCGCDGVTYGNDCERQSARVTKASDGPCPEPCGGIAGVSCSETDAFCEYEAGTCETADASGVCVSRSG